MNLFNQFTNGFPIELFIMRMFAILMALTFHEFFHGYIAYRLGDNTAKIDGRLSLNPIRHLDPVGAVLIILVGFGWAKPVMVDPYNLKNPKQDMAIISAAGPLSNLLMAFVVAVISTPFMILFRGNSNIFVGYIFMFLRVLVEVNVGLAIFNLIPIPPLDGSKILGFFLPTNLYFRFISFRWGFLLLLAIIMFTDFFQDFVGPILQAIFRAFFSFGFWIFGFLA